MTLLSSLGCSKVLALTVPRVLQRLLSSALDSAALEEADKKKQILYFYKFMYCVYRLA